MSSSSPGGLPAVLVAEQPRRQGSLDAVQRPAVLVGPGQVWTQADLVHQKVEEVGGLVPATDFFHRLPVRAVDLVERWRRAVQPRPIRGRFHDLSDPVREDEPRHATATLRLASDILARRPNHSSSGEDCCCGRPPTVLLDGPKIRPWIVQPRHRPDVVGLEAFDHPGRHPPTGPDIVNARDTRSESTSGSLAQRDGSARRPAPESDGRRAAAQPPAKDQVAAATEHGAIPDPSTGVVALGVDLRGLQGPQPGEHLQMLEESRPSPSDRPRSRAGPAR